ncbi:MAG: cytochrome c oxidase accessory protein CcoG [Ignavibacteria bacterium]
MNSPAAATAEPSQTLYAKRRKIYVRSVDGFFVKWRWALVWITQALFYGLCWLPWNGRQAVLFDLVQRKFYIFGLVFWPQDVFYLAVLLIISAYALFLFTAIGGRLFCGYACPQTVYTEIFMWIEEKIEGERNARMKLDRAPTDARKIGIKAAKHLAWIAVALWTGFTLAGYFTPIREQVHEFAEWRLGGWQTFWIFFYAFFTYLMAGFMREQVCKYMCPYARFQGVMFDPDTLIVTYDESRGEPRGARTKSGDNAGKGDCIDCGLCVQVCPTGIDIRNGLQYECIGCSACIDACDNVMDKTGLPRGLVRYSTENAMAKKWGKAEIMGHLVRPRIMVYTGVLVAISIATALGIAMRLPLKVDVIRDRGVMAREVEDGLIENVFTLRFMNTDERPRVFRVGIAGLDGIRLAGAAEVEVAPASTKSVVVPVRVPPEAGKQGSHPIVFDVAATDDAAVRLKEKAVFIMP